MDAEPHVTHPCCGPAAVDFPGPLRSCCAPRELARRGRDRRDSGDGRINSELNPATLRDRRFCPWSADASSLCCRRGHVAAFDRRRRAGQSLRLPSIARTMCGLLQFSFRWPNGARCRRKPISVSCSKPNSTFLRTTLRPRCGIAAPRNRVIASRNIHSACCMTIASFNKQAGISAGRVCWRCRSRTRSVLSRRPGCRSRRSGS